MNTNKLQATINTYWEDHIIPALFEYIKIPNKSPSFDPQWKANGHMDRVLNLATEWTRTHLPDGAELTVKESDGRTPLILIDIPGDRKGNILMYGHLDKQPEMDGWDDGLDPWSPVMKDEKLYGRGAADDGYALFASLCAVNALKEQNASLSGAGDYKRFWTTTSLRGLIGGTLRVDVLTEGVHSGSASGYVPSSFRVARQLLSRLENIDTGEVLLDELKTGIPDYRIQETKNYVSILGNEVVEEFPWDAHMEPSTDDKVEGVLRRTWMPALSIVGADGLPPSDNAGNVLRPYTQLQLSMRIPPMVDPKEAQDALEKALLENPPYNARVTVHFEEAAAGWNAPETEEWLSGAMNNASETYFGESSCSLGEGGTIPFMAMLGEQFPKAQFVITGVLGPSSNAHGPNEFLHVPYAKKLTACVASILNDYPQ